MSQEEFYKAFADLLTKIDALPPTLTNMRRDVGILVTAEKNRRVTYGAGITNGCIMEESDLNKLAAITQFDAISRKKDILAGRLTKSLKVTRPFVCDTCWSKYRIEEIQNEKELAKQEYENERREAEKAASQIDRNLLVKYVNSQGKEGKGTIKGAFWLFYNFLRGDLKEAESLKTMPYKKFLQSNYWWVVRRYVLFQNNFECKLCSKKTSLQVHHRRYDNRGAEYIHWKEDLIVLCSRCHAKHHDKLAPDHTTEIF